MGGIGVTLRDGADLSRLTHLIVSVAQYEKSKTLLQFVSSPPTYNYAS